MKKKVLILSSQQFGYLTDTLKYCQYASADFDITYIGWDYSRPKIKTPGINVQYVDRNSNLIIRNFKLLQAFHREIRKGYDAVFANYTRGISIVRLLNLNSKFIVDVRTLSVSPIRSRRFFYNFFLKSEIFFFKEVSVISDGVAKKLNLKNYHKLPLGGECFCFESKTYENLSFLYVGTLQDRNILNCVKGFHLFLKSLGERTVMPTFTIVGDSPGNELAQIREYIWANHLTRNIKIAGTVPHDRLSPYFESANVGIAYVPLRSYYNFQPPTKTFEYLISGLPVLATATDANRDLVFEDTGVLIQDNIESFFAGLKQISEQTTKFNTHSIRQLYSRFRWECLVKDDFIPFIKQVCI